MTSRSDINTQLCKALGLDHTRVTKVVLTLQLGELPQLAVTKYVLSAEGLREAVQRLRLVPADDESEAQR